MISLEGQHIFVAGGSRGIGRASALMAARAGASVGVNYHRNRAAAEEVVAQIEEMGRRAVAVQADISEPEEARDALQGAVEALGPLRGLVVSSGIFEAAPLDTMSVDFWERTLNVNLRGTFLATQAAAPLLRAAGGGSIVIIASTAGQRGSAVYSAYATSKGAQLLWMRSMAQELAGDQIRVNCIAPAWTETDLSRDAMTEFGREEIIAAVPLGRIGQPEDCAGAVCFLLSDLAAFITGSTITVDGGADMRG